MAGPQIGPAGGGGIPQPRFGWKGGSKRPPAWCRAPRNRTLESRVKTFLGGPGRKSHSLNPMSLAALASRSPAKSLQTREKELPHQAARSRVMSLGWGDGRLEGDMGLSQDGPRGPSQQANPQDSPPMASRQRKRRQPHSAIHPSPRHPVEIAQCGGFPHFCPLTKRNASYRTSLKTQFEFPVLRFVRDSECRCRRSIAACRAGSR